MCEHHSSRPELFKGAFGAEANESKPSGRNTMLQPLPFPFPRPLRLRGHLDLAWDKIYDSEGVMKGLLGCCGVRCHRRHQLDASLSDSETSLVFRRPGRRQRRRKRWISGVRLHEKLTPRLEGSLILLESEALLVPIPIHQLLKLWAHLPDTLVNSLCPSGLIT